MENEKLHWRTNQPSRNNTHVHSSNFSRRFLFSPFLSSVLVLLPSTVAENISTFFFLRHISMYVFNRYEDMRTFLLHCVGSSRANSFFAFFSDLSQVKSVDKCIRVFYLPVTHFSPYLIRCIISIIWYSDRGSLSLSLFSCFSWKTSWLDE